jgi:hypothetical protein
MEVAAVHPVYILDRRLCMASRPPSSSGDDDGGSNDLLNVGKLLPDYTALQPRRQPSSHSTP